MRSAGKLLAAFAIPPGLFIGLGLLGLPLLAFGPGAALAWLAALGIFAAALSLPAVAERWAMAVEPPPLDLDREDDWAQAEAILVLGRGYRPLALEYGGPRLDGRALERVHYAAFLRSRTGRPIYLSGGDPHGVGITEAELMRRVLEDELGVPVAGLERDSRDTWENARCSAALLVGRGIRNILLVTHAPDMARATKAFFELGLAVTPAPLGFHHPGTPGLERYLPSPAALELSSLLLYERLGAAYYDLRRRWSASRRAPWTG